MFPRKASMLAVALLLAISLLAWAGGVAFADTYTDTSADFNGQGVVVPSGLDPDNLKVTELSPKEVAGGPFRFVSPILDIQYTREGKKLTSPLTLMYVYFNMNHIERQAWDEDKADIYYLDPNTRTWVGCGTTFLVSGANPPDGRLACVVPQFTQFSLGIRKVPDNLQPGAVVSPGVTNASFYTENIAQTGNQGIYVSAGLNQDLIAVRVVEPEKAPETPFEVKRAVIQLDWIADEFPVVGQPQVQVQETTTQTQTTTSTGLTAEPAAPLNLTYVFYVLDGPAELAWEDGSLSIYYYDLASNSWQICPTSFYQEGDMGRVSCIATQFTFYALGIAQTSEGLSE